jgi:putative ABC transport system permease protein
MPLVWLLVEAKGKWLSAGKWELFVANDLRIRLRSLLRRGRVESEMEEELRFHSERQFEKYVNQGFSRDEAARRVRFRFGGMEQVKEECRDARGVLLVETFVQDVRYGCRTLRKSPAFAATALLTIALGIGANTALFSVIYSVLLSPLPFQNVSRLIQLNETTSKVGDVGVSYPNFEDWHTRSRTFSAMAAVVTTEFNMAGVNQPEHINGLAVSPDFLSMTGVHPILGRPFTPDEAKADTQPVLLLTYSLWQSHFGGNRNAIGKVIRLDSRGFTIVGVLPPNFRWTGKCDVMTPLGVWLTKNEAAKERGERGDLVVLGRLASHIPLERARAEMAGIAANLAREYPQANAESGVTLRPLRDVFSGDMRPAMMLLQIAAFFVLMVACANVANLFLMRGTGRAKELALRSAIGASSGRIIQQILTESLLVGLLGGLAGIGLALFAVGALSRWIPEQVLGGVTVSINGSVLLFSASLIVLSVFAFGIGPALGSTRAGVSSELKEGAKSTVAGHRMRWRSLLAIGELALALILLIGAGLMLKSLYRLLSVDSGFESARVLKLDLSLRTEQYKNDAAQVAFWRRVLDEVRAIPGVQSASLGTGIPLTGDHSRSDILVDGKPTAVPGGHPHPDIHVVSPGYEKTLGIRLLLGRAFTDKDHENGQRVAMVNTLLARRLFPGGDPLGKQFTFDEVGAGHTPKWITIVGVLADTRLYGLANPARLEVYVPFCQFAQGGMTLLVKSSEQPQLLAAAIRRVVTSIDEEQPVFGLATMQDVVDASVSRPRVTLVLLELFSGLALALAAIGIYGVISYSVGQRQKEIGIRVALGAKRGDVLRLVLKQGGKIAAAGILAGLLASLGLTQFMAKLLYSVNAYDPVTFAASACALALIAMVACYIPARRSLGVDPLIALRQE